MISMSGLNDIGFVLKSFPRKAVCETLEKHVDLADVPLSLWRALHGLQKSQVMTLVNDEKNLYYMNACPSTF